MESEPQAAASASTRPSEDAERRPTPSRGRKQYGGAASRTHNSKSRNLLHHNKSRKNSKREDEEEDEGEEERDKEDEDEEHRDEEGEDEEERDQETDNEDDEAAAGKKKRKNGLVEENSQDDDGVAVGDSRRQRKRRRKVGTVTTLLVIILFITFFTAPPKPQAAPIPEYTRIKPLEPSPDQSFADIMFRQATLPLAFVESKATDYTAYVALMDSTQDYCTALNANLLDDYFELHPTSLFSQIPVPLRYTLKRWWVKLSWKVWKNERWDPKSKSFGFSMNYYGAAKEKVGPLCLKLHVDIVIFILDKVLPLRGELGRMWGYAVYDGVLTAAYRLQETFRTDVSINRSAMPLLEATPFPVVEFSLDDDTADDNRALNSSLAIGVLKHLSSSLALVRRRTQIEISRIRDLNNSIDGLLTSAETVLKPRWEDWRALNHPGGYVAKAGEMKPSRRMQMCMRRKRKQALAHLEVLQSARNRISRLADEALSLTGPEVDQLKERMDGLAAGHGWTALVQHEDKWVQDWYYFAPRPDLPKWLFSHAENISVLVTNLSKAEIALSEARFDKGFRKLVAFTSSFGQFKHRLKLWFHGWNPFSDWSRCR
ncbi:hypothetical protein SPI_03378 [Niveomyces insectorum RCEF 264]|uniref:Uncharacterized protein n=1 Tax=Niveomyces insectorum RCEF 264 TaxID=1081102 RepID=A0A167XAM0_9HYPO|nr:hypothetical protein SPI_03378 [Niveomyces insectorum RCEF 264]